MNVSDTVGCLSMNEITGIVLFLRKIEIDEPLHLSDFGCFRRNNKEEVFFVKNEKKGIVCGYEKEENAKPVVFSRYKKPPEIIEDVFEIGDTVCLSSEGLKLFYNGYEDEVYYDIRMNVVESPKNDLTSDADAVHISSVPSTVPPQREYDFLSQYFAPGVVTKIPKRCLNIVEKYNKKYSIYFNKDGDRVLGATILSNCAEHAVEKYLESFKMHALEHNGEIEDDTGNVWILKAKTKTSFDFEINEKEKE